MLSKKSGKSHTMELPRQIVVGEKNIGQVGEFLRSLSNPKKVSIISGKNVKKIIAENFVNSAELRHFYKLVIYCYGAECL